MYSLHPGVIATELSRHVKNSLGVFKHLMLLLRPLLKTPEAGAQTSIFCAVDESLERETGLYYSDCAVKTPEPQVNNLTRQST